MQGFVHNAVFGIYPYLALTIFLVGSLLRFETDQYGWRSKSSQLLRRKQLVWGSVLFHVGILGILAGHFVGLLTPIAVFDAIGVSHGAKQMLAIVAGGLTPENVGGAIADSNLLVTSWHSPHDASSSSKPAPRNSGMTCSLVSVKASPSECVRPQYAQRPRRPMSSLAFCIGNAWRRDPRNTPCGNIRKAPPFG